MDNEVLDSEHLRASLVSAAEDLMKMRLEEEFMKTKAEVQSLHSTSKELLDGQEKINDIMVEMGEKLKEMETHQEELLAKEGELKEAAKRLEEMEEAKKEQWMFRLDPKILKLGV